MIAVADSQRDEELSEEQLALLEVMRDIARSAIPLERLKLSPLKLQGKGRLARLEAKTKRKERMALRKQALGYL